MGASRPKLPMRDKDFAKTLLNTVMVLAQAEASTAALIDAGFRAGCRLSATMKEAAEPLPKRVMLCLRCLDLCRAQNLVQMPLNLWWLLRRTRTAYLDAEA